MLKTLHNAYCLFVDRIAILKQKKNLHMYTGCRGLPLVAIFLRKVRWQLLDATFSVNNWNVWQQKVTGPRQVFWYSWTNKWQCRLNEDYLYILLFPSNMKRHNRAVSSIILQFESFALESWTKIFCFLPSNIFTLKHRPLGVITKKQRLNMKISFSCSFNKAHERFQS